LVEDRNFDTTCYVTTWKNGSEYVRAVFIHNRSKISDLSGVVNKFCKSTMRIQLTHTTDGQTDGRTDGRTDGKCNLNSRAFTTSRSLIKRICKVGEKIANRCQMSQTFNVERSKVKIIRTCPHVGLSASNKE